MIIHERKDGTIVESMKGVKAPPLANKIVSEVTFGEILRKEIHKVEEGNVPNIDIGKYSRSAG